jgi:hypothetical protein
MALRKIGWHAGASADGKQPTNARPANAVTEVLQRSTICPMKNPAPEFEIRLCFKALTSSAPMLRPSILLARDLRNAAFATLVTYVQLSNPSPRK